MKKQKSIPFEFVVEALDRLSPEIKPMFGCHAIYVREKIVVILRKKEPNDPDNGVWLATTPAHHASLKKEFPTLRSIKIFGEKGSSWQIIPEEENDFEEQVLNACSLILKNDVRIGKVPASKKKKK